uniref:DNA-directed RNA polymerase M/15kDa subunit domain-containing protein n=1 Tax=viral metagenome TaxID=1070528 RepID=A0A6C0BVA2_9ZZZZ
MSNDGIHFCKECHNITSIYIDEDEKLMYSCKTCGTTENFENTDNCIYTLNFGEFDSSLYINENKFITHDLTLPSIKSNTNLKCISEGCDSESFKFINYNKEDMKYIYICEKCGQKWKN